MAFEIWDVVTVPAFPNQENNHKTTTRPCIIIEDLNDQVVICPITKIVNLLFPRKPDKHHIIKILRLLYEAGYAI